MGCGLCAAVAPDTWQMDESKAIPTPVQVGPEVESANSVCPAIAGTATLDKEASVNFPEVDQKTRFGRVLQCYIGFSNSGQRENSSSGGLLTEYLCELLEQGIVKAVIHVAEKTGDSGYEFVKSKSPAEIRSRCKTRYYPVNLSKLREMLVGETDVALVANPCFTSNSRRLSQNDPENFGALKHFVAFFCGHWKSKGWSEYLVAAADLKGGSLTDFRSKIDGRPANKYGFKVVAEQSEKVVAMDTVPLSGWQYGLFKPALCDFCDDVGAELGDVVFGDAWITPESESSLGTSVVLVRSDVADSVIKVAAERGSMSISELTLERLLESQSATIRHRQDGLSSRLALRMMQMKSAPATRAKPKLPLHKSTLISLVRYRLARRSHVVWSSVKHYPDAIDRFNDKLKFELLLLRVVNKIPNRR